MDPHFGDNLEATGKAPTLFSSLIGTFTPLKTNECPLKRDYFCREYIFQPLIFRKHVGFQGSM